MARTAITANARIALHAVFRMMGRGIAIEPSESGDLLAPAVCGKS